MDNASNKQYKDNLTPYLKENSLHIPARACTRTRELSLSLSLTHTHTHTHTHAHTPALRDKMAEDTEDGVEGAFKCLVSQNEAVTYAKT